MTPLDEIVEKIKSAIAEKFAPAIDLRAPYAKVMIDHAARAVLSELNAAGVRLVPVKGTEEMLTKGVDLALRVNLSGEHRWIAYMGDLYETLLSSSPYAPQERDK